MENITDRVSKKISYQPGLIEKHIWAPYCRLLMTLWLVTSDLLSLGLAGFLALAVRRWFLPEFSSASHYYSLVPFLLLFVIGYALIGLYPGVGIDPVHEMRSLFYASSGVTLILSLLAFLTQSGQSYSRLVFLLFWFFVVVSVPSSRLIARKLAVILRVWGEPVALIGFGKQGRWIHSFLKKNASYGIRPVIVVNGAEEISADLDLPEISSSFLMGEKTYLARLGIRTAIIAPTEIPDVLSDALIDEHSFGLERLILVSSLKWIGGSAVIPRNLGGLLGLEVERNLLHMRERILKRLLDLAVILVFALIGFPVMVLSALLIRLDSPGPVFYRQRRIGKEGNDLKVWKFRTMVQNADQILEKYLSENPGYREEWESTHKLKNDPRVTRVGRLLRKLSLDELPQLINVLSGEMSLVGPRPIVEDEVKFYKNGFMLYKQVVPGITGLWQVSGRSDTSYDDRVSLDEYYIRHWSIWMDVYILIRTVWVVLNRNGAY